MKSINPDIVLKPVKEYVLMAVGMLMYSFGWIGCILPAGGVSRRRCHSCVPTSPSKVVTEY